MVKNRAKQRSVKLSRNKIPFG